MNVTVMSGKGKVHAHALRTMTLCNRDLGPRFAHTDDAVDCKLCLRAQAQAVTEDLALGNGTEDLPALTQADVTLLTGRVRHGMIRHARSLRRAAMKAQVRSL